MLTPFVTTQRILSSFATILISTALCTQAVQAQETDKVNFAEHKNATALAERLQAKEGIPASTTLELLKQAELLPQVVKAVKPPKTKGVRNWDTYRSRFVEPYRIRKGVEFWDANLETLKEAEAQYGIPQEVIVAIIGVETIYGQHIGNYRVLDSL
eukprot:gene61038-81383_t